MVSAYCGLHNDKYTKYLPHKKCANRALLLKSAGLFFVWISTCNMQKIEGLICCVSWKKRDII